jgi:YfiH family protein
MAEIEIITARWPAAPRVRALTTCRQGGVSTGVYASLNLAFHSGDAAHAVSQNRALLANALKLPSAPVWLEQVHGNQVIAAYGADGVPRADASWTQQADVVCAVMTADCLPVFICDRAASCVALAHAGWRGLQAGVIGATLAALPVAARDCRVWLGPAIGPAAFEVGDEVYAVFVNRHGAHADAFTPARPGHWWCDLYRLARAQLATLGVTEIYGGEHCTYTERDRFYSYRREGATGRMASLIWLD